jgi:hypothetical protein
LGSVAAQIQIHERNQRTSEIDAFNARHSFEEAGRFHKRAGCCQSLAGVTKVDIGRGMDGIAIGYEGDPATLPDNLKQRNLTPRQRKPLKEFVFTGKWGNPAPFLAKR